jgi:hypothetical protein
MSRLDQWKTKYTKLQTQKEERINKYIRPIELELDKLQSKIKYKQSVKLNSVTDGEYKQLKYFKTFNDRTSIENCGDFYFYDKNTICSKLYCNKYVTTDKYIAGVIPQSKLIKTEDSLRCEYARLTPMKDLRQLDTWKWMVKHGIELNISANMVYTIFNNRVETCQFKWETEAEHLEFVTFLNENGVDFTFTEKSNLYLHMCIWHNHINVLKYLDEHGDITKSCKNNTSMITKYSRFFKEITDYAMSIAQREK